MALVITPQHFLGYPVGLRSHLAGSHDHGALKLIEVGSKKNLHSFWITEGSIHDISEGQRDLLADSGRRFGQIYLSHSLSLNDIDCAFIATQEGCIHMPFNSQDIFQRFWVLLHQGVTFLLFVGIHKIILDNEEGILFGEGSVHITMQFFETVFNGVDLVFFVVMEVAVSSEGIKIAVFIRCHCIDMSIAALLPLHWVSTVLELVASHEIPASILGVVSGDDASDGVESGEIMSVEAIVVSIPPES